MVDVWKAKLWHLEADVFEFEANRRAFQDIYSLSEYSASMKIAKEASFPMSLESSFYEASRCKDPDSILITVETVLYPRVRLVRLGKEAAADLNFTLSLEARLARLNSVDVSKRRHVVNIVRTLVTLVARHLQ
jgi:hypothetical protein